MTTSTAFFKVGTLSVLEISKGIMDIKVVIGFKAKNNLDYFIFVKNCKLRPIRKL